MGDDIFALRELRADSLGESDQPVLGAACTAIEGIEIFVVDVETWIKEGIVRCLIFMDDMNEHNVPSTLWSKTHWPMLLPREVADSPPVVAGNVSRQPCRQIIYTKPELTVLCAPKSRRNKSDTGRVVLRPDSATLDGSEKLPLLDLISAPGREQEAHSTIMDEDD